MAEGHIFPFLWMRGEPEQVIRREIQAIYDCGIRALCVEARPHPDFCGPGWWRDMDIVLDEAEKRGMRVWILDDKHFPTGYANGLIETKYPERRKRYLNFTSADVFGAQRPIELDVKRMLRPTVKFWEMGKPANEEERARNYLVSVTALRCAEGALSTEERIDLTGQAENGVLRCTLPKGQWRIIVVYHTRTDGGDEAYINLIDEKSAHTQIEGVYEEHYRRYEDKFGTTIAGFFSDEPQFGNYRGFEGEGIVGKMNMPMPWSDELETMLRERYGEELPALLPYLWFGTAEMRDCPRFRYDYMDCVSLLYEKNFSGAIGGWCRAHGVEYIGHVVEDGGAHARLGMGAAHYFRAMSGQDMAGIDCIGGQVVYGAPVQTRTDMVSIDGEFCHYTLGKLGASAAHLDPAKSGRCMCELFGAYGWEFGVRDQKYVLDHLLSRGVNYLVPHAFSMAEYPDPDCPPHFFARGNHPEYPWFQSLMKYAEHMCASLSGGEHIAPVAVLYDAEAEWAGERTPMQKIARELQTRQIEFDFISLDMLGRQRERYQTRFIGESLFINGQEFHALVVPYTQRVTAELCAFIEGNPEFPVIFTDALPETVVNGPGDAPTLPEAVKKCAVLPLEDIAVSLENTGLRKVKVTPAFPLLSVYQYQKDGKKLFFVLNESPDEVFEGELALPSSGALVIRHGLEGCAERLPTSVGRKAAVAHLVLQPAEAILISETDGNADVLPEYHPLPARFGPEQLTTDISSDWRVSYVRAVDYPGFKDAGEMPELVPFSDKRSHFSGVIRYERTFTLPEITGTEVLECENVFEVMRVAVNGRDAGITIQPPYRINVGAYLRPGENRIQIEVATTPQREQDNYPASSFVMKHSPVEPTGMFGAVGIYRP